TGRAGSLRRCQRRRTRGPGAGGDATARFDRAAQPRGAATLARGVRGGERAFPDAVRDAVRRWFGASGAGRFGRSARGGTGDHGAAARQTAPVADLA
ncbi:hypothetical protein LTR94_036915, partial [Friedmanniomyces endolithicus]